MKITVKFFASAREIVGRRDEVVELPDDSTVRDVWTTYTTSYPQLAKIRMAFAVNHEYAGLTQDLKDGDELAVIPPVSGG